MEFTIRTQTESPTAYRPAAPRLAPRYNDFSQVMDHDDAIRYGEAMNEGATSKSLASSIIHQKGLDGLVELSLVQ